MRDLRELEHFRRRDLEFSMNGGIGHPMFDRHYGIFQVPVSSSKRALRVIATSKDCPGGGGWDHVSVSLPARCPSWDEMSHIKHIFFRPEEVAMQLHPAESEHISNHPYCLHLWAPGEGAIPLPPSILVGLQSAGELTPESSRELLASLQAMGAI